MLYEVITIPLLKREIVCDRKLDRIIPMARLSTEAAPKMGRAGKAENVMSAAGPTESMTTAGTSKAKSE